MGEKEVIEMEDLLAEAAAGQPVSSATKQSGGRCWKFPFGTKEGQKRETTIFELIDNNKFDEFEQIVEQDPTHPYYINRIGRFGDTVLHILIRNWNRKLKTQEWANNPPKPKPKWFEKMRLVNIEEIKKCGKFMLGKGIDVNVLNRGGCSALYTAAEGLLEIPDRPEQEATNIPNGTTTTLQKGPLEVPDRPEQEGTNNPNGTTTTIQKGLQEIPDRPEQEGTNNPNGTTTTIQKGLQEIPDRPEQEATNNPNGRKTPNTEALNFLIENATSSIILEFGEPVPSAYGIVKTLWQELTSQPENKPIEDQPSATYLIYLLRKKHELFEKVYTKLPITYARELDKYLVKVQSYLTLLQRACLVEKASSVKMILEKGAQPDETTLKCPRFPAHIACQLGNLEVLTVLLDTIEEVEEKSIPVFYKGQTPYHATVTADAERRKNYPQRYINCLDYIAKRYTKREDITKKDEKQHTALDYAVLYRFDYAISLLMDRGKYILTGNIRQYNITVPRETMEEFLDNQIIHQVKYATDELNETIEIDYTFLKPLTYDEKDDDDDNDDDYNETELLREITMKEKMLPILKHPVLEAYINMKWKKVHHIFWFNFIVHFLFTSVVTVYVLEVKDLGCGKTTCYPIFSKVCSSIIGILLVLMTLRECVQLYFDRAQYFCDKDNWFEVPMLILTMFLLAQGCGDGIKKSETSFCSQIEAGTILLAWAEVLLLLGRVNFFSQSVIMLIHVSYSFFKYGLTYLILILAFAFSFFILFRDYPGTPFTNLGISIFKNFIMFAGEFDTNDIPFSYNRGLSYAMFIIFILLVSTIIINLLNGLAVSDIKEIKEMAEIYSLVAKIEFICLIDKYMDCDKFDCLGRRKHSLFYGQYGELKNKNWKIAICPEGGDEKNIVSEKMFRTIQGTLAKRDQLLVDSNRITVENESPEDLPLQETLNNLVKSQEAMKKMIQMNTKQIAILLNKIRE